MNPERCQTCTVMISWSMLSIKKIICKQRRYVNYLSKFKRFPLETTKLHRRWFDLWRLYVAIISKPSQILTTALRTQIMAPRQVSTFSDLFYIFNFFGNEKVHFWGGSTHCFCILPFWVFLHKASTCGEDHKRDFYNHFSTIIYVPIVENWITCIKRKENAVNHLNIANEPRKMPNLHRNDFMVYVEHRKKNHVQTTKMHQLSLKI